MEGDTAMGTELLKPSDLSAHIGTPTSVLANWRYMGRGPKFVKLGKSVRYRVTDVEAWLDEQTRQQTGAGATA